MNPEKYTIKLREGLNSSLSLASKNGNPEINAEHLLLVLIEQSDGLAKPLLEKLGVSVSALEGRLKDAVAAFAKVRGGAQPQMSQELRLLLEEAESQMSALRDEFTSVEHFLLALAGSNCATGHIHFVDRARTDRATAKCVCAFEILIRHRSK